MVGKRVFWNALLSTLLIFLIGFSLGFFLEMGRVDQARSISLDSEINLLDEQLRETLYEELAIDCEVALTSTFSFADRIYDEAAVIADYADAEVFGENIAIVHKRYDLLRTILWTEAITLRNECGADFHTIVYLYDFSSEDLEQTALQSYYSSLLLDLKYAHPGEILLIPIAADMNLSSVDLLMRHYTIESVPSILIDEKTQISESITLEALEDIIFDRNN